VAKKCCQGEASKPGRENGKVSDRYRHDYVGIGLLALGFACLETLLSKGEQWDRFGDPFDRVQWLDVGAAIGLGGIVGWSLWKPDAVIDVRVFADRNFAACSAILFLYIPGALCHAHPAAEHLAIVDGLRRIQRRAGW
jgi:hypothetical protein